jgi:hypothetical protein
VYKIKPNRFEALKRMNRDTTESASITRDPVKEKILNYYEELWTNNSPQKKRIIGIQKMIMTEL